jgi:hypothetical protein
MLLTQVHKQETGCLLSCSATQAVQQLPHLLCCYSEQEPWPLLYMKSQVLHCRQIQVADLSSCKTELVLNTAQHGSPEGKRRCPSLWTCICAHTCASFTED